MFKDYRCLHFASVQLLEYLYRWAVELTARQTTNHTSRAVAVFTALTARLQISNDYRQGRVTYYHGINNLIPCRMQWMKSINHLKSGQTA